MKKPLYLHIAHALALSRSENEEFKTRALDIIQECETELPSGIGIDCGCTINSQESRYNKLVINFDYHHLSENGYYDGWTKHKCIVRPDFGRFDVKITGRNRNDIKSYLLDLFYDALEIHTSL